MHKFPNRLDSSSQNIFILFTLVLAYFGFTCSYKYTTILTVFVPDGHDSVHVVSIIDTECRQVLHIHPNIWSLLDLQSKIPLLTTAI